MKLGGSSQDRMFPVYYHSSLRAAPVLSEVAETLVGSPPSSVSRLGGSLGQPRLSGKGGSFQGSQAWEEGEILESHREEPKF